MTTEKRRSRVCDGRQDLGKRMVRYKVSLNFIGIISIVDINIPFIKSHLICPKTLKITFILLSPKTPILPYNKLFLCLFLFDTNYSNNNLLRLRDSEMYGLRSSAFETRCKICRQRHRPEHSCSSACLYCHQYHPKTQMSDTICPHLRQEVRSLHEKDQFQCRGCQGEGVLEKEITTIFYEKEQRYLKRLKKYDSERKERDGEGGQSKLRPQRKVIRTLSVKQEYRCEQCKASGKIRKVITCCVDGCHKCNYEKCRINPVWSSYFCESISVICVKRQNCIACALMIELTSEYCRLGCGHNYHCECYVRDVHLGGGACGQCGYQPQQPNIQQQERMALVPDDDDSEFQPDSSDWREAQVLPGNRGQGRAQYSGINLDNALRQIILQSNIQQERQQIRQPSNVQHQNQLGNQIIQSQMDRIGMILGRRRNPSSQPPQSHETLSEGADSERSDSSQQRVAVVQ